MLDKDKVASSFGGMGAAGEPRFRQQKGGSRSRLNNSTMLRSSPDGDEDINLVLSAGGSEFVLKIGAWHNSIFAVDCIHGITADRVRSR
jgi:hypothetical protein